jgi:hypothetical protein
MNPSEQKIALRMLALRHREQSILSLLWQSRVRFILLLLLIGAAAWLALQTRKPELRPLGIFMTGFFFGALLRDFAWFRIVKRTWLFHRRVLDWGRVEAIAEGQDVRDEPEELPESRF